MPRWLITDWPLAVICVFTFVGLVAGLGALIGLNAGVATNGFRTEGVIGAVSGAWMGFAALGADTAVVATAGDGAVIWASSGILLSGLALLALIAWLIFRSALTRVGTDWSFTIAFVVKVAVLTSVAVGVLGAVTSIGDIDDDPTEGFGVVSRVGFAEAAWWALVLMTAIGLLTARRRLPRLSERLGWLGALRSGAAAWAVMVLLIGIALWGAALVKADSTDERFAGLGTGVVVFANGGVAGHAIAVGSSDGTTTSESVFTADDPHEVDMTTHLSLFHLSLPPESDAPAAPLWLWPVLALAPALSAGAAWRWLQKRRPADASGVLLHGCGVALGFALASWLGALFAPLYIAGASVDVGRLDVINRSAVAAPSVAATLGLSLMWGLLGAVGAALIWARRRGIDMIGSFSSATAQAPHPPCPHCGAPTTGSPFCSHCGRPAGSSPT